VATLTTTAFQLPGGTHTITAQYAGDGNFNGGTSNSVSQVVNPSGTSTAVVSSVNPSGFGQPGTFTATVTPAPPGGAPPTGTVTFFVGSTHLGSPVALSGGSASITTAPSDLALGANAITAQYSGDTNYTASTGAVTQNVTAASSTTTLTAAPSAAVA